MTIAKPSSLFLSNKISLLNERSSREYVMSKTGEAGASGWGPQDENMGLARRFLIVFISYCSSDKYEAVPVEIICIPYLSFPSRRSRNFI